MSCPGKQAIYHAIQEEQTDIPPELLIQLDEEIQGLLEDLAKTKASSKHIKLELTTMGKAASIEEMRESIEDAEKLKTALEEDIRSLRQQSLVTASEEEQKTISMAHRTWKKVAADRRRICKDLWDKCSEVLPDHLNEKEFWVCNLPLT